MPFSAQDLLVYADEKSGSSFEYIFSLFNGCISIEVVQDESDHKKTFHLKTFGEIDYWGFRIYDFSNNYDVNISLVYLLY